MVRLIWSAPAASLPYVHPDHFRVVSRRSECHGLSRTESPPRQFSISVIGAAAASPTGWLIRNRPSRATAYRGRFVDAVPPFTMRVGNSATGVPASNDAPAPVTGTAIIVASGARKYSSFPSARQRGATPPAVDTGHLPVLRILRVGRVHQPCLCARPIRRLQVEIEGAGSIRREGDPHPVRRPDRIGVGGCVEGEAGASRSASPASEGGRILMAT